MRRRAFLLVCTVALAACGGGGGDGGTTPQGGNGNGNGNGAQTANKRLGPVLECLQEVEQTAYQLQENAISMNTETSGVEVYFLKNETGAKNLEQEISATGIGAVFRTGTVVEAWITPPTAEERKDVQNCVKEDPGPG